MHYSVTSLNFNSSREFFLLELRSYEVKEKFIEHSEKRRMPCGWIWVTVMDVMSLIFNSSRYNVLYFSLL